MIGAFIQKYLATPILKTKSLRDASVVALASLAEAIFQLLKSTLAEDVGDLKKHFQKRVLAQTQIQQAEARKRVAEAADAANKTTSRVHEEELRRLERERLEIENRKNRAKAARAEAKASAAILENAKVLAEMYDEARKKRGDQVEEELYEALQRLNLEGGRIYFDSENLKRLIEQKKQS